MSMKHMVIAWGGREKTEGGEGGREGGRRQGEGREKQGPHPDCDWEDSTHVLWLMTHHPVGSSWLQLCLEHSVLKCRLEHMQ